MSDKLKTAYIFFVPSNKWWATWLKTAFNHVAIVIDHPTNDLKYIAVEALDTGVQFHVLEGAIPAAFKPLDMARFRTYKLLKIKYVSSPRGRWLSWLTCRWGLLGCVAFPHYVLNLKPVALTPYRLFKKLQSKRYLRKNPHIKSVDLINLGE